MNTSSPSPAPRRLACVVLLLVLASAAGCATGRPGTTIDILGLPRTTEGGTTTNRNRVHQRPPAPPPAQNPGP